MSIFSAIGHFFVGLFNAAKKAYDELNEDQKIALQQGTGLVAIINNNLSAAPAEVRALIVKQFPTLDEAKLEAAVFQVAQSFNLTHDDSLDDVIAAIQKYLQAQTGNAWAVVSHAIASLLSILFAPPETKVSAVVSLIEWVYQHFIKQSTEQN